MFCRILRLREDGLLDKWKKMYWPEKKQCGFKSAHRTLTITDVQGFFYLMSGGLVLALIVLVIENGAKTFGWSFNRMKKRVFLLDAQSERKYTVNK